MCSIPDQNDLVAVPGWQRVVNVEGPVGDEGGYTGFELLSTCGVYGGGRLT